MVQLLAFRRSLRFMVLALCSASIIVFANPASARPHHGAGRHARAHHAGHHARYYAHYRRHVRASIAMGSRRGPNARRWLGGTNASLTPDASVAAPTGAGSSNVVAEARRYLGGNPTGRGSLWCARFMNMVLQHSGYRGTGSDMANSFAHYGQRISGPQVGAIAVMGRRGGGHVGIITGIDASGNPIMISGNNGNRVREAPISRGRIYAYVMPAS